MPAAGPSSDRPIRARLDVWLWRARFAKTRSLAADLATSGHVRIDGRRATTAAQPVRVGDILTIALARDVRVVRVTALGWRRGPATEARDLYDDDVAEPQSRTP